MANPAPIHTWFCRKIIIHPRVLRLARKFGEVQPDFHRHFHALLPAGYAEPLLHRNGLDRDRREENGTSNPDLHYIFSLHFSARLFRYTNGSQQ
jgi:hypothetical protein